jgi:adenylate cyclase
MWPHFPGPLLNWLIGDARKLADGGALLINLCERLNASGLPLARASFHLRLLHPQLFGMGFYWSRGAEEVRIYQAEHGIQETDLYQKSPMRALFEGKERVRQRLDQDYATFSSPQFHELKDEGLTEYVALPLVFGDSTIHGTTWATDRPGGFDENHLAQIEDLLPVLGLLLEVHLKHHITVALLDTYVGQHAGEHILEGQITRGSGETIEAAIWLCDLRGFTAMAERQPRDRMIACLNDYFDRMATPVKQHGGEILKFIGDAMLAVFPLDTDRACERALAAAIEARDSMHLWNEQRVERGDEVLNFGIALHAGDVMYGNIGTADRLDFTVIGPAVNMTSRMERLCRSLGIDILISDSFAELCASQMPLRPQGTHQLEDIARPVELFTVD